MSRSGLQPVPAIQRCEQHDVAHEVSNNPEPARRLTRHGPAHRAFISDRRFGHWAFLSGLETVA